MACGVACFVEMACDLAEGLARISQPLHGRQNIGVSGASLLRDALGADRTTTQPCLASNLTAVGMIRTE